MTADDRMSLNLVLEVIGVLERHGYQASDDQHAGQAIGVIRDLARVYEGTRDAPYGTYLAPAPPAPRHQPGPPAEPDDDAVILSHAEASTVSAALDIAAACQRDHAATCADCANQSCPACQSRLQDARAYSRTAAQLLQTADAARAANRSQPQHASPGQPRPAADREAGQ